MYIYKKLTELPEEKTQWTVLRLITLKLLNVKSKRESKSADERQLSRIKNRAG